MLRSRRVQPRLKAKNKLTSGQRDQFQHELARGALQRRRYPGDRNGDVCALAGALRELRARSIAPVITRSVPRRGKAGDLRAVVSVKVSKMFGDLTTLADVKAWLKTGQNPFPITDDALLIRLVTAASQYIQSWLNRPIASADYLEVRDGTGGETLQFACFPVTEVTALTIDGRGISRATSTGVMGYTFSSTQLSVRGCRFSRGLQNIVISYTAGYTTIPYDIAQACIELVALRYRERSRIGELSRSLGGAETVAFSQKDLSDAIKTLLQQYRAVIPVNSVPPLTALTSTDAGIIAGAL